MRRTSMPSVSIYIHITKLPTDSPEGIRTETAKVQSKIQFLLMHLKKGTKIKFSASVFFVHLEVTLFSS